MVVSCILVVFAEGVLWDTLRILELSLHTLLIFISLCHQLIFHLLRWLPRPLHVLISKVWACAVMPVSHVHPQVSLYKLIQDMYKCIERNALEKNNWKSLYCDLCGFSLYPTNYLIMMNILPTNGMQEIWKVQRYQCPQDVSLGKKKINFKQWFANIHPKNSG